MIVARIAEDNGVTWCGALNDNRTPLFRQFQRFSQLKETLTVDSFRNAPPEQIAIALHEAYRLQVAEENRQREADGKPRFTPAEKPADVEWEVLPDSYRESTRLQAAGIVQELASLPVPREVVHGPGKGDPLTADELNYLAKREHDRWMADRAAQGWKYGEKRDNEKKLHPDMVGWDQLSEASKAYDHNMVAAWPKALEGAGLVVRRKG